VRPAGAIEHRRVLATDEVAFGLCGGTPGQQPDVSAGKQRADARDVAGEQARLYHPELRPGREERFGLRSRCDRDQYPPVILRKFEALHRADGNILELELRLADLKPFGVSK
jgi:hypothetical protein